MTSYQLPLEEFQVNLRAILRGEPLQFGWAKGYRVKDPSSLPLKVLEERDLSRETIQKYFTLEPKPSSRMSSQGTTEDVSSSRIKAKLEDYERKRMASRGPVPRSRVSRADSVLRETKNHDYNYSDPRDAHSWQSDYDIPLSLLYKLEKSGKRKVVIVNTKKSDKIKSSRPTTSVTQSERFDVESLLSRIETPKPKFDQLKDNILQLKIDKKNLRDRLAAQEKEKEHLVNEKAKLLAKLTLSESTPTTETYTQVKSSKILDSPMKSPKETLPSIDILDPTINRSSLDLNSSSTLADIASQIKTTPTQIQGTSNKSNELHIYVHSNTMSTSSRLPTSKESLPNSPKYTESLEEHRDCECCSKRDKEAQKFSPDGFNDHTIAF